MKIQTEREIDLLSKVDVFCAAMVATDAEEFMAYLKAKYPDVATAAFELMVANVKYSIEQLEGS